MKIRSRLRSAGVAALVVLLLWLGGLVGSTFPALHVLATSVDGLTLADYRADPLSILALAPLTGQITQDAYRDARGEPARPSSSWFGPSGSSGAAPPYSAASSAASPSASPSPSGSPAATPTPSATPTSTPTPTGTPTPTQTPTPTPAASPTPTPTPTSTPPPTPAPTPTPTGKAQLIGTVVSNATGNPIAGATVTLSPGGATATTDATGRFTIGPLNPRMYTMTVSAPGYSTASQPVTINAGKKTTVTVRL